MRAIKVFGFVVGGLVALLVIILVAVSLFVNPNDYKGRIAAAVKDSTGRELDLPGDIKLSVFPWVALELGPASLGNPAGFGTEPFAAVKHAALRVRLLPLLHKELQIGRIEVDGLDLRLKKDASGKGNWQDFGKKGETQANSGSSGGAALQDVAGIVVKDSRLAYQDMVVDHLNLDVGHVGDGRAVPVKASLDLISGHDAPPVHAESNFTVTLGLSTKRYQFTPLQMSGTYIPKVGVAPLPWDFTAPELDLDLAAQTLAAPAFTMTLAAAHIQGGLSGTKIVDAPAVSGSFKLAPIVLRELMGRLAMTPPVTRDPRALSKLAASGDFGYGGNAAHVDKLDVQLDESNLRGNAALTNLDTKAMRFDLSIDKIDLDRYMSPQNAAPKPDEKPFELPNRQLKALEANGTLSIGAAKVAGMNLTNVKVSLDSKGGITRIAPAKAQLYGGQYSGDITLDDRTSQPVMNLNQTMTSIDVAQLLSDFAKTKRLSGRGNVTTKLTAHGKGSDALMKTLSGRVEANLANGAVEGLDLWYEINRAQALLNQQALPSGSSSGRTKFDTFKASADVASGVATTKDLNITSQLLRVTGQGYTNLVSKAVDYDVKATVLKSAPAAGANSSALTLAEIPVKVTGTLDAPKVRPDVEGMAKARVQQELEKHKGELQQKLQDKLKGLFGR